MFPSLLIWSRYLVTALAVLLISTLASPFIFIFVISFREENFASRYSLSVKLLLGHQAELEVNWACFAENLTDRDDDDVKVMSFSKGLSQSISQKKGEIIVNGVVWI